jgi:hypothetical protein
MHDLACLLMPQEIFTLKGHLARISHQSSTATAQWCTLHDFCSVTALNIVSTMSARPPNNDCRCRQSLLGVVAKVMQGTAFHRLATKAGEKYGLGPQSPGITDTRLLRKFPCEIPFLAKKQWPARSSRNYEIPGLDGNKRV